MHPEFGRSMSVYRGTIMSGGWLLYLVAVFAFGTVAGLVKLDFGTAGISLLFCALSAVLPVLRWKQHVEVFENGFIWKNLFGAQMVRKGEVKEAQIINHISKRGTVTETRITLANGKTLSIKGIDDPQMVAKHALRLAADAPVYAAAGAGPAWSPPGGGGGGWNPPGGGGGFGPPGGGQNPGGGGYNPPGGGGYNPGGGGYRPPGS